MDHRGRWPTKAARGLRCAEGSTAARSVAKPGTDHQWGNYGWLKTLDGETEMLGWDWLGINLEDGTDLIVICTPVMR